MEVIIFEPEYRPAHYAALFATLVPGVAGMALTAALGLGRGALYASLVLLFALPMLVRAKHIRRVVFDENLIVVRYLLMDRYFKHKEFHKIGTHAVVTPRGHIQFGRWLNRLAFLETLQALHARGVFVDTQFDPDVPAGEMT